MQHQLNIISILNNGSNDFIIHMQKQHPLKIVGFSNVKYDKRNALKFSVYFYCENCKQKILLAHNIDPAFMSHFKIGNILYKDYIVGSEKLFPIEIDIDFKKIEYIPFRGLRFEEQSIFYKTAYGAIAANAYEYIANTYIAPYTHKNLTIFIPNYLIGKFFYFPNSRIKEAFHAQNLESLHYPMYADCDKKSFVLKTRTGQYEEIIKLICLYHCNEFAKNLFLRTSALIKNESKKPNCFTFPLEEKSKVKLLGKFVKEPDEEEVYFVAYDLIDVSLKNICGEQITYSFMGKNRVHPINIYNIYKDTVDLSEIDEMELVNFVNSKLKEAKSVTTKDTSEFNDIQVVKTEPQVVQDVFFRDININTNDIKKSIKTAASNGIVSSNGEAVKLSGFATFYEGIRELEILLGQKLAIRPYVNLAYIQFMFKNRYVIIVEYGDGKSGTYIFSSDSEELFKRKMWLLFKLNDKKTLNLKRLANKLREYNVCFHPIQKHTSRPRDWAMRIIEKLNRPGECKK